MSCDWQCRLEGEELPAPSGDYHIDQEGAAAPGAAWVEGPSAPVHGAESGGFYSTSSLSTCREDEDHAGGPGMLASLYTTLWIQWV